MTRSFNHVVLLCSLLALAVVVGGCQRGSAWTLAPVEGTITKGGRPQGGIQVFFLPDADTGGPRSSGVTDETGHYHLRTDNGDDGAAVGKYRILVLDLEARKAGTADGLQQKEIEQRAPEFAKLLEDRRKKAEDTPRVPPSYERFNETPLRAEVGRERLTFDIVIP